MLSSVTSSPEAKSTLRNLMQNISWMANNEPDQGNWKHLSAALKVMVSADHGPAATADALLSDHGQILIANLRRSSIGLFKPDPFFVEVCEGVAT